MEIAILGSLLMMGGLLGLSGLFDSEDDNETTHTRPNDITHGGAGADRLISATDDLAGWGGDDDLYVGGQAEAWGNAGKDFMSVTDTAKAHGGDGRDVVYATDGADIWGDDGNDALTFYDYGPGHVALGDAYGGLGDDTLSGLQRAPDRSGHGILSGDAGNDVITVSGQRDADGGIGNDTVVVGASLPDTDTDATVTLGSGADLLLLDPSRTVYNYGSGHNMTTVTDFDPSQDQLALQIYGEYLPDLDISITHDTAGGFSDLTLTRTTPGTTAETQILRILGVTDLTESDILLYEDRDALLADRSYGTLDHPTTATEGNDTITMHQGTTHGLGGDDDLTQTFGQVYGDAGNDLISKGPGDAEFIDEDYFILHASAYGGDGQDTITGSGESYGGQGDDLIQTYSGTWTEGGDGNDTLIIDRSQANASGSHITLGAGQDTLALNPVPDGDLPYTEFGDPYEFYYNEIVDFDPAQDHLALIIPQDQLSEMTITLTADPATGYTDLKLGYVGSDIYNSYSQTYRLHGVTTLTAADIDLYTDDAAVLAGTPWQRGLSPAA